MSDEIENPYLALLLDASRSVDEGLQALSGRVHAAYLPEQILYGMFNHCGSLFRAILPLAPRSASAALILSRPLFEHSVRLTWLADQDEGVRRGVTLKWAHEGLNDLLLKHRDVQRRRVDDVRSQITVLEGQLRSIERSAVDNGLVLRAFPKDPKQMARDQARHRDCAIYEMTHQFVHGRHLATSTLAQRHESGAIGFGFTDDDTASLSILSPFAVRSMLTAYIMSGRIFKFSVPDSAAVTMASADGLLGP